MRLGWLLSKTTKSVARAAIGLTFGTSLSLLKVKEASMKSSGIEVTKEEEEVAKLAENLRTEQNLSNLNRVVLLDAKEYKEGQVYGHEIIIKERKVRIVIIKHKGEFYCLGGVCSFDGKTRLSEGVVFGDKLLAPENGSAYNILNGQVEYGPAIDNIPIFQTLVGKDGKLVVMIPDVPPKKIKPLLVGRDFNDLRRVVFVGSDPAVISCAETLRQFEYSVRHGLQREKSS